MSEATNASYISPHEILWHRNDFKVGERYVTDDRMFTVTAINDGSYQDLELTVRWETQTKTECSDRVYPNLQWIALNWEDSG